MKTPFASRASIQRVALSALLCASSSMGLRAQARTDIYVAPLQQNGREVTLGAPVNLTKRPGYDNQPSFTPDGSALLYTAVGAEGQADSWTVRVSGGTPSRLTNTAIGIYSPTVMPNGESFSVIRVERDSTQRLWKFPLNGGEPSLVLQKSKPVGYHAWLDARSVVVFILGSPATLHLVDVPTETATQIASNIGRALVKVPHHDAVNFIQIDGKDKWVAEYDRAKNGAIRRLGRLPEGADYIAWTNRGALLTAAGSIVYRWNDGEWKVIADLSSAGIRNISRLAISPSGDRLAFVADDP